jgi:hypothetical protein
MKTAWNYELSSQKVATRSGKRWNEDHVVGTGNSQDKTPFLNISVIFKKKNLF